MKVNDFRGDTSDKPAKTKSPVAVYCARDTDLHKPARHCVVYIVSSDIVYMVALILKNDVKAMIGIAAAPDFTDWGFTEFQRATILRDGVIYQDNPYGPDPTPTYLPLLKSGQAGRMLAREIDISCPVRLLHGQCDADVPWDISMQLAAALRSSDVQISLVKDGDHRLSRDSDIALLLDTVRALPY